MKNIKLAIFDLDGTLVNAFAAINTSFNYTMRRLGYPRQAAQTIRRAVGWGDKFLLRPFLLSEDCNKGLLIYRRHHKKALLKDSKLYPGVRRLLIYLRSKGYFLAIASNRPTLFSRLLIKHHGLERYFSSIVCADTLKQGKPHPQILQRSIEKFSLCPSEAVFVGDMLIDAQTGRRAKVKTIIVLSGSGIKSEIQKQKPFRIIKRIASLFRIL